MGSFTGSEQGDKKDFESIMRSWHATWKISAVRFWFIFILFLVWLTRKKIKEYCYHVLAQLNLKNLHFAASFLKNYISWCLPLFFDLLRWVFVFRSLICSLDLFFHVDNEISLINNSQFESFGLLRWRYIRGIWFLDCLITYEYSTTTMKSRIIISFQVRFSLWIVSRTSQLLIKGRNQNLSST